MAGAELVLCTGFGPGSVLPERRLNGHLCLNDKVAWVGRARYGALADLVLGSALVLFLDLMGRTVARLF